MNHRNEKIPSFSLLFTAESSKRQLITGEKEEIDYGYGMHKTCHMMVVELPPPTNSST